MSQEYGPAIAGSFGSGAKAAIKVLVDEMLQSSSGDEIYFQAHRWLMAELFTKSND